MSAVLGGGVPESIAERAKKIVLDLLPKKSREQYEKEYELFQEWNKKNGVTAMEEGVMLTYLHEKSKTLKPSSFWSKFSMLKATLSAKENLNIDSYSKVTAFLKRQSVGYEPKKSKVLSREEINNFLKEAPDETYLMVKVALLIGICGACRREELHSLKLPDIDNTGNSLIITLADTKTNRKRVFSVVAEGEAVKPLELFHKYARFRPENVQHNYFFISYRNQKCTVQRVGIHTFGRMPRMVAEYLKLPNPELYTGHCFRRTSATLVADAGGELITLKRHGGWRSMAVVEGYIEDSLEKKRKVSKLILGHIQGQSSVSTTNTTVTEGAVITQGSVASTSSSENISFSDESFKYATDCHFHISK